MLTKRMFEMVPTGTIGSARATEDTQIGSALPHHALVQHRPAVGRDAMTSLWLEHTSDVDVRVRNVVDIASTALLDAQAAVGVLPCHVSPG